MSSDHNQVKNSVIIGYGTGHFGYGFITQMITSYLVFYGTAILFVPGSLIGLIVSISIIWDAISDPIMGYISDNTVSKYGKRHVYILFGTVFIAITNIMLWNVKIDLSMWLKFVWLLVSVVLIKTFVTVFITPYSALGSELSTDYEERSKIQAVKTIFFLASLMIVNAVCMVIFFKPTPEYTLGQLNPQAYTNISYTASFVVLFTGILTHFSTRNYICTGETKEDRKKFHMSEFIDTIKNSMKSKDFRQIFLGFLFTNLASAIISVIGLHTFTYTFNMNNYEIAIVFGIQFTISILAQPIWLKIASKIDKKRTVKLGLKLSMIACGILLISVIFKDRVREHYEYLIIYSSFIGFSSSGLFSLPLSMIGDAVDEQEYETGERNEGVYFGMLNFGYKTSQSIAILILGILLDLMHFDAKLGLQSESTVVELGVVLSVGSFIAFYFARKAYSKYSLNEKKVMDMQNEIKKRNQITTYSN